MHENVKLFHFPGLINVSLSLFESFGNRLRSKAASFALKYMVYFPFSQTIWRYACPYWGWYKDSMNIRIELIALNHHIEI